MYKGDRGAKPKQSLNTSTKDPKPYGAELDEAFSGKDEVWDELMKDFSKLDYTTPGRLFKSGGFEPDRTRTLVQGPETVSGSKEEDILTMIKLGAKWGSNLQAITTRGKAKEKELIGKLILNYKLVPKPMGTDSVTLSRVMLAFPDKTCEYMASMTDHKVTDAMMDLIYYPPQMKCAAFGNFIPRLGIKRWEPLVRAFAYHRLLFNDIINPEDSRSASAKMAEVLRYIGLARTSPLYQDPIRIEYLCRWGIYDRASNTLSPHVLAAAAKVDCWLSRTPTH